MKVLLLPSRVALGRPLSLRVSEGVDPQSSAIPSFPRLPLLQLGKKVDFEKEETSGFFWLLPEFSVTWSDDLCSPGPLGAQGRTNHTQPVPPLSGPLFYIQFPQCIVLVPCLLL